jgi:hypothetical protein
MRALDLLNEAVDPAKTAAQMGEKIKAKFIKDRTIDNNTDVETFIANVANHIDPTPNHQYTLWILRMYVKNGIRLHEDLDRVSAALNTFHTYKKQMPIKDLGQIKSLSELEQMISNADVDVDAKSGTQEKKDASAQAKEESKIFYKGPEGMIVIPETEEASCFWGKGTQWCTASTSSTNQFNSYSSQGDLYIILPNDGTKWQLHTETNSFLDAQDEAFDLGEWSEEYPWAHDALIDVYPGLNPLSNLRKTMSPDAFVHEVEVRANSASFPQIDGIDVENNVVILEKWDDMENFIRYEDVPEGYEDSYHATQDEDAYLEAFSENVETTRAFEEAVTSLLSDAEKSAIAKKDGYSASNSNTADFIMGQPEYVNIIGMWAKDNPPSADNDQTASNDVVEKAVLSIINRTLDVYAANFKRNDDGTIYLLMDLDDFVEALDAEHEEESDYKIYAQAWTDANNSSIDDVMTNKYNEGDGYEDDTKIVNKFISQQSGTDFILAPEKDTRTKDMFGGDDDSNASDKEILVVPQSVIADMVDQVKRDLRGLGESDEIAKLKRNAGLT